MLEQNFHLPIVQTSLNVQRNCKQHRHKLSVHVKKDQDDLMEYDYFLTCIWKLKK